MKYLKKNYKLIALGTTALLLFGAIVFTAPSTKATSHPIKPFLHPGNEFQVIENLKIGSEKYNGVSNVILNVSGRASSDTGLALFSDPDSAFKQQHSFYVGGKTWVADDGEIDDSFVNYITELRYNKHSLNIDGTFSSTTFENSDSVDYNLCAYGNGILFKCPRSDISES